MGATRPGEDAEEETEEREEEEQPEEEAEEEENRVPRARKTSEQFKLPLSSRDFVYANENNSLANPPTQLLPPYLPVQPRSDLVNCHAGGGEQMDTGGAAIAASCPV